MERGQKIEVVVLDVNPEKERINLGLKQLEKDPYAEAIRHTQKGDIVTVEVTELHGAGVDVSLENGRSGFIKRGDLSSEKNKQRSDACTVGERKEAIVLDVDKFTRIVNLSIKALEIKRGREAIQQYGSTDSGASLGDILGAALSKKNEESSADTE
jgi:small subunit ribosomal protein S1